MTRRSRIIPPAGYRTSTKGHSVLKKWAYGSRAGGADYDDAYVERYIPTYIPRSHYDTGREEREIHRGVDREIIFSDHMMDECYDTARRSHNKDAALLREATAAVPPSKRNRYRRYEDEEPSIPLSRYKSTYVPYQKRSKKAVQPPTDISDGITTRHLKATRPNKTTTITPLGTLASRSWTSSSSRQPPPKSYQELTSKYPPDYYDRLISSIPSFTRSIGNIDISPIGSLVGTPCESPYTTPRESPERELVNGQTSLSKEPLRPPRRGLRSKHNVGSYYRKLLRKRANQPGRKSKYWPYYDVESIGNSDVAGLFSDEEYEDVNDNNPEYYEYDNYPRDNYSNNDDSYYVYNDAPSQVSEEYVPFVPRRRNFDEEEYNPALPDLPDLAVAPYIPPNRNGGSGISEDMAFHNIVAQTAAKARKALRSVNLNDYDNASLVLSVEGEYTHPERGDVLGFHYVARPIPLKGPNLATGPAYTAASSSDESSFSKYLKTMRDFREGIRQRLESGYAALRDVTRSVPTYSSYKPVEPKSASSFQYSSPMIASYRKELEDGYGFGGSISLYPLHSHGRTELALPSAASEALPDHTHTMELFDSKADVKLSTLDKIKIKVNSETYSDPRAVVASRRAARGVAYYNEPPRYIPPPPPQQPKQQPPRTNYPSRRLEKEVVVLFNPYRLRPRPASSYYARVLAKAAMAGRVSLADYHPSPVTRTDLDREMAKRTELIHTIGRPWFYRRPYYSWYPYYSMYRYYRYPYYNYQEKTPRVRVLASPLPQKRKKSLRRTKAALVGSKVDVVLPKRRRPRSQYAQSVMRDIKRQEIAKADDVPDDSDEVVVPKVRPRPRKLVSFRKYPTTHVPDTSPKVEDVASRLKSMLKKYKTISAEQQAAHVHSVKSRVVSEPSKPVDKYVSPIDKKEIKSQITIGKEEVPSAEVTTGLKAHPRVPHVGRRGGKAIRDEDGQFTKPKNLLSWKYRLEARTAPGDYFQTPRTFANMRDQIRHVRDKMDRHRQLMDRYLDTDTIGEAQKSPENTGLSTTKSPSEGNNNYITTPVRPTSARVPRIPLEIPKLPKRRRFLKSRQNRD